MSGAKRDFFRFCEEQDRREREEQTKQLEQNFKQQQKGQPSPVDDGNLKGKENGIHCH